MRVTHLSLSGGAEGHYHHPVSRLQMENDDLLLLVPKKLDRAGIQQGKEARARLMKRDSGIESEATALLSYSPPRDVMRDRHVGSLPGRTEAPASGLRVWTDRHTAPDARRPAARLRGGAGSMAESGLVWQRPLTVSSAHPA